MCISSYVSSINPVRDTSLSVANTVFSVHPSEEADTPPAKLGRFVTLRTLHGCAV